MTVDDAIHELRRWYPWPGAGDPPAVDVIKAEIAELRAERDELREKVERYERMTIVYRDGKVVNEVRTS